MAGSYGFSDGNTSGDDYAYDLNGNMVKDLNKNLLNITYNHLNLPDTLTFANDNSIVYVYTATGTKLKKTVNENGTTTTTEYDNGFIYKNGTLKFFGQPEGYVEPDGNGGFTYVYQYKDQLGNVRLSYKNTGTPVSPQLTVVEENNYYPFGLEHKGYNNVVNGNEYKYKTYQGQELNDELNLNWLSFKYRNYDPAIGRFMSVDPLATKYPYNGVYNFSENRVVDAVELEGKEASKINLENGDVEVNVKIKPINSSYVYPLTKKQTSTTMQSFKQQAQKSYSGKNKDGNQVNVKIKVDPKATLKVDFTDAIDNPKIKPENYKNVDDYNADSYVNFYQGDGFVKKSDFGNTQTGEIQVSGRNDFPHSGTGKVKSNPAHTISHELGHIFGLQHKSQTGNLMRNGSKNNERQTTPEQRSIMLKNIPEAPQ